MDWHILFPTHDDYYENGRTYNKCTSTSVLHPTVGNYWSAQDGPRLKEKIESCYAIPQHIASILKSIME